MEPKGLMRWPALYRWVPRPVRRGARDVVWLARVRTALRRLEAAPSAHPPARDLLDRLYRAWGNDGWTADLEYLEEVARCAVSTPGPILECGSGATTLLLAILAAARGVEVWVLEDAPAWHARVARALGGERAARLRLCATALRDFGDFDWYDAPVAQMPRDFRLVVCDGPPGTVRGGRYGLVPILGSHLAPGALILLDNADRPKEMAALERWQRDAGMRVQLHHHPGGVFAVATGSLDPR